MSTANNSLRVLRRILNLSVEWSVMKTVPRIKTLPGERRRERVVTRNEEARYLAAAPEPLASIATVLADTGMRPEECFRLGWESVTWASGRNGSLLVSHGKTASSRRVIPLTPRVRAVLELRWEAKEKPDEGWIWPAPTTLAVISSLRVCENNIPKTFKTLAEEAAKRNEKPMRPFVLYSLRHTFLTRLGEARVRCLDAGANRWARIDHCFVALCSPV